MNQIIDPRLETKYAAHLRIEAAKDNIQIQFRMHEGHLYCQVAKHWYKVENALQAIKDLQSRIAPTTEARS